MVNGKNNTENTNGSLRLSATALGRALVVLLFALTTWALVNTVTLMVDVGRLQERVMAIERAIQDGKDVDREQWRRLNGRAAERN